MTRRGWLLFGAMGVIWGLPYLMIKVAVGGVSTPVVVFARTAVGAAVLLPLALRGGQWRALRGHWPAIGAFALVEMIGPWWLLADAERTISSSLAGLLIAMVPILGALAGYLLRDTERLGGKQWTGLAVGFGGVALLAAPHLNGGSLWSVVEVLLVTTGYAIAPLIAARKLRDVPVLPMTVACLTISALFYAPFAALTWPTEVPAFTVLAALAGLAVLCTAIAFIVFFALIREVGPARGMVFTYINPVVAVIAGVLLLGEQVTPMTLVSFALVLTGSLLATARPRATTSRNRHVTSRTRVDTSRT